MSKMLIFAILSAFTLFGCVDALELEPENSLTFGSASTEKELESSIREAQRLIRLEMMMYYNNTKSNAVRGAYADVMSDDMELLRNMDLSIIIGGDWRFHYDVIACANRTYYLAGNSNIPEERKNYYKGQACFFKAFAYYELIKEWGDCVLIKDDIEPKPIAKSPWTQVADYAILMAKEAVALLPEWDKITDAKGSAPKYRSAACRGAANTILAYLCAWKAGGKYFALPEERDYDEVELWKMAEQACSEVIKSPVYELAGNPEDVCTSVLTGNSKEGIFETVYQDMWSEIGDFWRSLKFGLWQEYEFYPLSPIAAANSIKYQTFRIKSETVKRMFPDGDLRRDAYFYEYETMADPDSIPVTGGFAYPYKWRKPVLGVEDWDKGELYNINQNKIWYRLADVYLLRAECRARLGGEYVAGAISDLNKVRERADAKFYEASEYGGDLRYTIFKEREKELLMEGHRYYDIVRNGYARRELEEGFRKLADQDFVEGAFFTAIEGAAFNRNPLMRQNTFWLRRM